MFDEPDRGSPTSLRGWLSDIYLPVLLDEDPEALERLLKRLGGRATVDDPIFGRASGLPTLERFASEMSQWLKRHQGAYERAGFTTGIDRDVSEGTLTLSFGERTVKLPMAIVAERRPSREVELRLYYSTLPINGSSAVRSPVIPSDDALALPTPVEEHVAALGRGDVVALLLTFESSGTVREARGVEHANGAELRAYYEKLFAGAGPGGVEILKGGTADDGRTCALEVTLVKVNGRSVPPQAGLAVYERGDSGLIRSLRIYDDLES